MVLKPPHSLKVNFFILKYKKKYLCLSNDTVETIYMFDTPVPNQDWLILPLTLTLELPLATVLPDYLILKTCL